MNYNIYMNHNYAVAGISIRFEKSSNVHLYITHSQSNEKLTS